MELARGASYIASALHGETLHAAVAETVGQFDAVHGRGRLKTFAGCLS
ncbi:hypothetical protein WN982_25850 [Paraburkholderia sp. IMGN_8]